MKTCQILLALFTVILVNQVRSQDVEFRALHSHLFVPFGEATWLNCSTPFPNQTFYETRLRKISTERGPNWLAVQVIVDDWENSTSYCLLSKGEKELESPTIVMAYALPSEVTIDLQTELEEGNEYTINCTVYEVAPLECLTINITREGNVIDSKSYNGPHVVNRTTVSHLYTFNASRSDNLMNFSCEAILQLGSETQTSKSLETTVQTYTLPEAPVITVQKWIAIGTTVTAECLVTNGFPSQNVNLRMLVEDTPFDVTAVPMNEGTVKGTVHLNDSYLHLGLNTIICEAHLFTLSKETRVNVTMYEPPAVSFVLSRNIVDLEDNVTATCNITNTRPEDYGLNITVDGEVRIMVRTSTVTDTFTVSKRTQILSVICTPFIIGNSNIAKSFTETLQVHYPPEFNFCPSISNLVEGNKQFLCQADGNPKPTVVCSDNGRNISGEVTVTRDMSGIYSCQATNQKGSVTKSISVTVQYPPTTPTVTVSTNATVSTGNPLNITCKSDGLPSPTYCWEIPNNAEVTYSPDKSSIIIHSATSAHNGTYRCVTKNLLGKAEAQQKVTIVPQDVNIGLIVGIVVGSAVLIALFTTVWYLVWKKDRKGFYELLWPGHRQCHQNGNIPSEIPVNSTTGV